MSDSDLMTSEEAAKYLRWSMASLYRAVARGDLPTIRLGAQLRFRKSELDKALDAMSSSAPGTDGK